MKRGLVHGSLSNTTHTNGIGREPDPARRTRISQAHPTRPPARTATESTTMDSNVQIVSHVCTVCAEVQLAAASSTNRGVHVHTRAPVILAWRVLRGGDATPQGKVAQSHTRGKGGGSRWRGETPHPWERWRTATPKGRVAQSHTHGKGGGSRLRQTEGEAAHTALTRQLTGSA